MDDDFTECEVSRVCLVFQPDHHVATSFSAANAAERLRASERPFTVISADLPPSGLSRRLGVRDSNIEVVQTLVCK